MEERFSIMNLIRFWLLVCIDQKWSESAGYGILRLILDFLLHQNRVAQPKGVRCSCLQQYEVTMPKSRDVVSNATRNNFARAIESYPGSCKTSFQDSSINANAAIGPARIRAINLFVYVILPKEKKNGFSRVPEAIIHTNLFIL